MNEVQTAQLGVEVSRRYRDRSWLSIEDSQCLDVSDPVNLGKQPAGWVTIEPDESTFPFDGVISTGQNVFLPDEHLIGLTTKLFVDPSGHITHLAIRTARLFGHHKMVPIAFVREVTPLRVQLSITREQFMELHEYQSDPSISEEVDRALWKDVVLRDTDYHQIDFRVRDGVVIMHGHVITGMNQWRAETAVKNIPGILGFRSYLIPDDKLTLEVAGAMGQLEQDTGSKFFTKVENGVAVLMGEVSSTALRDQAEECVAQIPWVRGILNEICVPGVVSEPEDQRFLQPLIGKELLFKDGFSVTVQKVVINPKNRRVVAMVVRGRFPDMLRQGQHDDYGDEERGPERLVVLPVQMILHLTHSSGFLQINSTEMAQFEDFEPTRYITPEQNWMPPYPYCTDEVLFLVE